jgi:predicted RNA binding protein YcfA (HicA-like mRNA interferase family)
MLFTDLSSKRIIKAFEKAGFWLLKTSGKKHIGMSNGRCKIIIPRHSRINPYTLKGIIRDAGLTDKEFKELI